MANLDLEKTLTGSASRRTVVATGAKVAYAAPLIAASFKLSNMGAGAVSPGGRCETFVCGSGPCHDNPEGFDCFCFETVREPGVGICNGDFLCGGPTCSSDADCGGGTCVTNTCCGQGVQLCAPPCGSNGNSTQGTGLTAGGRTL